MPECRKKIARELEGLLTKEEVEAIFSKIERRFGGPFKPLGLADEATLKQFEERLNELSPEGQVVERAKRAFEEAVHEKKEALRRTYLQTERTTAALEYVRMNAEKGSINAVIRLLVGDMKGTQRDMTVEGRKNAHLQLDLAEMFTALDEYASFFSFKMDEAQALNIAAELDSPGSSGDPAAQKLVEAWEKWANRARARKNELGADIGYLKDWHMPQSWDPAATRKFGLTRGEKAQLLNPLLFAAERTALLNKARSNFIDEALPRVDRNRYLDKDGLPLSDEALRDVLGNVFETITSRGLSEKPTEALLRRRGLAAGLGEHRELHFKSAADWYQFNKLAGDSDILGIMQRAIIGNARDTALLEVFGPNPEQSFKTVLAWAKHWDGSDKGAFRAELYFGEIAGASKVPVSERGEVFANAMQGVRHWMVATKLGSLLLSQVNDLATYAAIARSDGLGVGRAIEFAVKSLSPASGDDRRLAHQLGIATQSIINDVGMRYGEAVKGVDFASRMASATIKLSGAEWWTNSMKRGFQQLVAFNLHTAVRKGREAMGEQFGAMLRRYGIGDAEWEIIGRAQPVEISGEPMITPVAIKMLGDDPATRETALKIAAMMTEEADIAIVSPGAREMGLIKDSTRPGTLAGEFMRSTALFKTFSIALSTKVLPRVFAVEGTAGFRAGLAAQFALGMIVAGGISYQLKQLAFGRNPRDVTTPEFWLAAAAQSGGMGIFGDYLFADYNRFGGDVTSTVFGPMGGLANDLAKLTVGNARQALMDKETHFAAETMQFIKNNTPFVNLWYTRAAFDHLLFFTLQEAANPGYLRRMRRRVERENNQTFWWEPQDRLPEEAPDMGYMFGGSR